MTLREKLNKAESHIRGLNRAIGRYKKQIVRLKAQQDPPAEVAYEMGKDRQAFNNRSFWEKLKSSIVF